MPPGRPIVSDCNLSKNVASFIDSILKPPAMKHPSYIKNTYDFVDKIAKLVIPDGCLLITLDVERMYTNIDHAKGLNAVPCVWMETRTDTNQASNQPSPNKIITPATVWHSQNYGRFSCCGVIKAFEVMINKTGDIEFQVWNITEPVTKTATFLGYYRAHVDIKNGMNQTIEIPFYEQMPIRDGNAIGWIADESDIIMWATSENLTDEADSDYLFQDLSEWSKPFANRPTFFSSLLNQHTFSNKGIERRVFGIRPVVNPGYTVKIENLPLSIPLYNKLTRVNKELYSLWLSGVPDLEKSIYITVDVQINPNDGYFGYDNETGRVIVKKRLIKARFEIPYEIKFTVSDGCHSDQTASLHVYVFNDDHRIKLPVCQIKELRGVPPSAMWNQEELDNVPKVTEVGCPAPKIAIPPEKQYAGHKDLIFGWGQTSTGRSMVKFKTGGKLPATHRIRMYELKGAKPNFYEVGKSFKFYIYARFTRDYGIRYYVGPETGHANVTVKKDTLHGLEGTTYELVVSVKDTCTATNKTIKIYIVTSVTSTTSTTTTTKPTTITTEPTTTTTTTTTKPTTTTTKPTTSTTATTTTATTTNTTTTTKPTYSTAKPTTTTTTTLSPELYTRSTAATCSYVSLAVEVAVGFMVALCHTFT
ncbi:hypothetical protein LSH36_823g02003 [Paralvinella palmiformis]|uniref:Uncharacterized protein n=1 Tax=Paralvinella palmiformis TaxID=53620 RepID=A0AAD9J0B2_9ANNE|nr:hypothetical protein LSH36_823g02003 [Paralvinella palmiformis]